MMNKLYCFMLFFFSCGVCDAQYVFQKIISSVNANLNWHQSNILQLEDSSFVILCNKDNISINTDTTELYLLKVDASGNIVWQKVISNDSCLFGGYIAKAQNGFMITATSKSVNSILNVILTLINVDNNGDTLWTKSYKPVGFGNYLTQMPNGDWMIIGSGDFAAPGWTHFVMRTDSIGNIIDCKNYYTMANGGPLTGIITSDGGQLIFRHQCLLTKIDVTGNVLWSLPQYSNSNISIGDAVETRDSCYLVLANSPSMLTSTVFFKVNNSGDTLWTKAVGDSINSTIGRSMIPLPDGGVAVCGQFYDGITSRVLLFRLDSLANVLWSKSYIVKENSSEFSFKISPSNDNGFIIQGNSTDTISIKASTIIIKTDSTGNSLCSSFNVNLINSPISFLSPVVVNVSTMPIALQTVNTTIYYSDVNLLSDSCLSLSNNELILNETNKYLIYPIPFSDELIITINNNGLSEIILYDITSRKLLQQKFTNTVTLNTAQLAKGMYLYEVRNKNGAVKKGKVIKD